MKRLFKVLALLSLVVLIALLTGHSALAQDAILSYNIPITRYPYYAKMIHAGAAQLCPYNPDLQVTDATGATCSHLIAADTYLTIVNPGEPFPIPCATASATTVPANWYFTVWGYVVLYDSNGNFIGTTRFTVKPKGNYTVSIARIILLSKKTQYLDCRMRKYTYEIIWYRPYLTDYLNKLQCVIRPPIIPISVEVKEIIYHNWFCYETIRKTDANLDLLINRSDIVKTWSETILDKSNMIFPLYYIAEEKPVLDVPNIPMAVD